jgi:hypothetical protein
MLAKFFSVEIQARGVTVDGAGNVFVADSGNHTIRKISQDGLVTTVAGFPKSSGSSDGVGSVARFKVPNDVALDGAGNIYVADTGNNTIRKIDLTGLVTTVAGLAGTSGSSNGVGATARFNSPSLDFHGKYPPNNGGVIY